MVESGLRHVKILEDLNFNDIVISLKASDARRTIEAYRLMADKVDYPLHLGVTEAGTPFGGTIAHGFLTLSMLSAMAYDAQPDIDGQVMGVNYGLNHLRFLAPVPAGSSIRAHFTLNTVEERKPHEITVTWGVEVEIKDRPKPALVAEWVQRRYLDPNQTEMRP